MSLRERIGAWLLGNAVQERASHPPVALVQSAAPVFGPGLATQPAGASLLRENLGVADMATRAIANRLSSLELQVVVQRRRAKGTVEDEILDDHPLALLLATPHPDFTRAQLLRLTGQYLVTLGSAYWLKTGNGLRVPARLTPLYPHKLVPIVSRDVIQGYMLTDENGAQIDIAADEIIAFRLPDPENIFGGEGYLGPNAVATDAIRFQTEHIRSLYQSNAIPPALLKATADAPPPTPEQLDRFNADWIRRYHHRNGSSAGLPGWLPPGFDVIFAQMQTGADVTPLLDYFDRQQLRNFGVPRSVLGEVVSGDRSSAETNQYVMDLHTVTPIAQIIADALSQQLAPDFDAKLKVRFKQFVAADKAHELAKQQADLSLKVRSINEVRTLAGEDPVEWGEYPVGSFADIPYTGEEREPMGGFGDPSALEDDDDEDEQDDSEQEQPEEDEPRTRDAEKGALSPTYSIAQRERWVSQYGSAMKRKWQQIFREQQRSVQAKLDALTPRSRVSAEDLFLVHDWTTEALSRLVPIYVALQQDVGQHTYTSLGIEKEYIFTAEARKRIERHAAELVTQVNQTTKRRIAKALSDGVAEGESIAKMAKRLDEVFGRRKRDTKTIARTEVGTGATRASIDAVKQSGSKRLKRWITARDADVRDDHVEMEGVTVELDELFELPDGSRGEGPSDPRLAAGERINCRCSLIYPRADK